MRLLAFTLHRILRGVLRNVRRWDGGGASVGVGGGRLV